MLSIILMRFIDASFICSIYGSDSLRPELGPPDWHWLIISAIIQNDGFILVVETMVNQTDEYDRKPNV